MLSGFSKKSRDEKVALLEGLYPGKGLGEALAATRHPDGALQAKFEQFSENTIGNFHLPFGVAPNFVIDGDLYHVPMAIEESSVVAAAAKSAKFWASHGGFRTVSLTTVKRGQVHFTYPGDGGQLQSHFEGFRKQLVAALHPITQRMEARGGGLVAVRLVDMRHEMAGYFQLDMDFETVDSMGANFINTVLEKAAQFLTEYFSAPGPEILMAILSNYTPESKVVMKLEAPFSALGGLAPGLHGEAFAEKFRKAAEVARISPQRAVTHNKGIMNGADAVILATGNDFRATEAGVHAFAARDGQYRALTRCTTENQTFRYTLELPLAVGTVGGLTRLHPLAALALDILGQPAAPQLMKIIAAAGLANNFGAVRSLITTGIQRGHMKLHLGNILSALDATPAESEKIKTHFAGATISFADVKQYIDELRNA